MHSVSEREARAHRELILLFEHHRVKPAQSIDQVIDAGLFSEETWRLFGLNEGQLVVAGTIGGAAAGALFDLATLDTPSACLRLSAPQAEPSDFLMGKRRPELKAKLPGGFPLQLASRCNWAAEPFRRSVPGSELSVDSARPCLRGFLLPPGRAHARRDEATLGASQLKAVLEQYDANTSHWSDEKRKACEKIFDAIRRNKSTAQQRNTLRV